MPAQYVKPYVKTNKSDYIDAEAIAEGVQRPRMRFVPIKTEEQLDLQALHRVRERWVMRRTVVVNQIRSLLLERGLTLPTGRSHLDEQPPRILEDAELNLSGSFRVLLAQLKLELEQLAARIEEMDRVIQKTARENESCQRLTEIPEVGPVTAAALIAAVGNAHEVEELPSTLPLPCHSPFFSPEAARNLLARIETLFPQAAAIPLIKEILLSPELDRTFDQAKDVQDMFHHEQIGPLHLLEAVLAGESSQHAKLLEDVGITKERVSRALKAMKLVDDMKRKEVSRELARAISESLAESQSVAEVVSKAGPPVSESHFASTRPLRLNP